MPALQTSKAPAEKMLNIGADGAIEENSLMQSQIDLAASNPLQTSLLGLGAASSVVGVSLNSNRILPPTPNNIVGLPSADWWSIETKPSGAHILVNGVKLGKEDKPEKTALRLARVRTDLISSLVFQLEGYRDCPIEEAKIEVAKTREFVTVICELKLLGRPRE